MFNKKVKELAREIEKLKNELRMKEMTITKLEAKVDALTNGRRCSGPYCDHCENCGPGKIENIRAGVVITEKTCLPDVPCPDFKRKDGE